MKTKEDLNTLREELKQVSGGHSGSGTLDSIMSELYRWLIAHPDATIEDINKQFGSLISRYADSLTPEELENLRVLLKDMLASFANLYSTQPETGR